MRRRCATPPPRTRSATPTCSAGLAARARRRPPASSPRSSTARTSSRASPAASASRASPSRRARRWTSTSSTPPPTTGWRPSATISRAAIGTPGRTKVYILDEVHMLSTAASNALLKTLEEPPGHVVFILATTDPQKVLPTIKSRTQHLQFSLLDADELAEHLTWVVGGADLAVTDEALQQVLREGAGSARDTLSALDRVAGGGSPRAPSPSTLRRGPGRARHRRLPLGGLGRRAPWPRPRLIGEGLLGLPPRRLPRLPERRPRPPARRRPRGRGGVRGRMSAPALTRALEVLGEALGRDAPGPDPASPRGRPRAPHPARQRHVGRRPSPSAWSGPSDRDQAWRPCRRPGAGRASAGRQPGPCRGAGPRLPLDAGTPCRRPRAHGGGARWRRSRADRQVTPPGPAEAGRAAPPAVQAQPVAEAPAASPSPAVRPRSRPAPRRPAGPRRRRRAGDRTTPGARCQPAAAPAAPASPAGSPDLSGDPRRPGRPAPHQAPPAAGPLPWRADRRTDGEAAVFALPNDMHRQRCEEYRRDVETVLAEHFRRPVPLQLVVDADVVEAGLPGAEPPVAGDPAPAEGPHRPWSQPRHHRRRGRRRGHRRPRRARGRRRRGPLQQRSPRPSATSRSSRRKPHERRQQRPRHARRGGRAGGGTPTPAASASPARAASPTSGACSSRPPACSR